MSTSSKWGLTTGALLIGLQLINAYVLSDETQIESAGYAIIGACLFMGVSDIRRKNGGFIRFGSAFRKGFAIVFIAGLISMVFTAIRLKWLQPELLEKMYADGQAALEAGKDAGTDETSQAMVEALGNPWTYAAMDFFLTIALGLVFSLLVALFVQRNEKKNEVLDADT